MADTFLQVDGSKHGPYEESQLQRWVQEGSVAADTPAWRAGMRDWMPLSQVVPLLAVQTPAGRRAYRPPPVPAEAGSFIPGFSRAQYVGIYLLAALLLGGLLAFLGLVVFGAASGKSVSREAAGAMATGFLVAYIVCVAVMFGIALWLGVKRLRNIGWHPALVLLMLVPVANIVLAACLVALPPDYARTRKLDGVAWTWFVIIGLGIAVTIVSLLSAFSTKRMQEARAARPSMVQPQ